MSLRELAKQIGMSHTTVGEALRDHPRVSAATRARVKKAAVAAGYTRNVLAGAVMSEVRRNRVDTFRGTLAVLDLNEETERPERVTRFYRAMADGARRRAAELDFKTDEIGVRAQGLSLARLDGILRARGIRGLLLLPMPQEPDIEGFDWSGYTSIYTDYVIRRPGLHCVCPDHYRGMAMALDRLHELGYQRPGLVLQNRHDARLLHRWEASFLVYQNYHDNMRGLPMLTRPLVTEDAFKRWFLKSDCDAVLAHEPVVRRWMAEVGARVPETHGFCCLNLNNTTEPCAGLDLHPGLLGERALELLIGPLMRNECGVPARPTTTTLQPDWVDGPTLRGMKKPA